VRAKRTRGKNDSRRRWKARYRLGQWVPTWAIVQHRLEAWADSLGHQVYYDVQREQVRRL
jgi:hypothetical protein